MGPDLLTLFMNGIIFFCLLIVIEVDNGRSFKRIWWFLKSKCSRASVSTSDLLSVDEDVLAEASLVDTMIRSRIENPGEILECNSMHYIKYPFCFNTLIEYSYFNIILKCKTRYIYCFVDAKDDAMLLVSGLTKHFFGSPTPAVNSVSFRVSRGECLGLLGVNGAGKTTTFRMLTGDEKLSYGDAYIDDDVSLLDNTRKFVREIGYCPQFDAILGELTGEEMLTLLGRLRGVSESRMKHVVNTLITLVGLNECAKRQSSTYSGGNKRKLSTAMALVGSPPLVFLDEPTSGVDPASRRRVWAAVTQAVNNGQSVVLTSHSMEECEALCSRIIIMSRGVLRCVGTTGHLKAKFGQGYMLQIKLKTYSQKQGNVGQMIEEETYNARLAELKNVINLRLKGSKLTDEHKGMLAYRIPSSITWGHLFSVMEALKYGQNIDSPRRLSMDVPTSPFSSSLVEDYAATDTSLEQVFLSFAREANDKTLPQNIPTEVVTKF
ncbi:ATP-binding cassette sub- A member 3 [Halocaridina rubra]|uniref:ATP-binding cassette sub- A member 3 n=1 Tax=Halocaridina rubra TaxID=373956 RepID=A0AAN8XS29_HALRR